MVAIEWPVLAEWAHWLTPPVRPPRYRGQRGEGRDAADVRGRDLPAV